MSTRTSSIENGWLEAARTSNGEDFAPVGLIGAEVSPAQLDLLADEDGKLPPNVFTLARAKGPGRPMGAVNRSSRDIAKFHRTKYGCPAEFMASVRAMPLDQITHVLREAEGYSEREEKLFKLIDSVEELQVKALNENWSEAKLKLLDRMLDRIEKAASSMKAKPGDLATKALALQLAAARDEARYVLSPMPVLATVDHRVDGTIVGFVAPGQGNTGPVGEVMKRIGDAVRAGDIEAGQVLDFRVVDGEYRLPDEDSDDE